MVSRADSIKSEKQQDKAGMNLFSILKDYIDSMLSEQQGRKALILDEETLGKFRPQLTECSDCVNGLQPDPNSTEGSLLLRANQQHSI